jgi:hypothetical protein
MHQEIMPTDDSEGVRNPDLVVPIVEPDIDVGVAPNPTPDITTILLISSLSLIAVIVVALLIHKLLRKKK